MKTVEEEIQIRYRNERHRAVSNLLYTYNNVASRLQKMLSDYNLTLQQFNILRILQRRYPEPACNFMIREQMLDARSDITRIVDRLIKEELVERKICDYDRRKVNIVITQKGLTVLKNLEQLNEKMDAVMACLTDEELSEINRLLEKIRAYQ